jgi:hypothetical protein
MRPEHCHSNAGYMRKKVAEGVFNEQIPGHPTMAYKQRLVGSLFEPPGPRLAVGPCTVQT